MANGTHLRDVPPDTGETAKGGEVDEVVLKGTPKIKKLIADIARFVSRKKGERKAINEEITAKYSEAKAAGIPPEAIKRALKDADMDQGQRDAVDYYYALARKQLNIPIQESLFPPEAETKH